MQTMNFKELLEQYICGELTTSQRTELAAMMDDPAYAGELDEFVQAILISEEREMGGTAQQKLAIFKRLQSQIEGKKNEVGIISPVHRIHFLKRGWFRYAAAAVFILAIAGITYLFVPRSEKTNIAAVPYKGDIVPGRNGAVLTLSNGQKIILDSAGNGLVISDGKVQIIKKDGEISYQGKTAEVVYNTIATDKGRQWTVTLPDGSKVWLNAASSIHYPLTFTGNERVVEITGEAYFEVVHNARQPFKVKAGNQVIEDIGTAFNVNAYTDEAAVKTTLIEGSVKVTGGSASVIIKPGEQASRINGSTAIEVSPADVEATIAWKNGIFKLSNSDVASIMRQVSRWYDIEVTYKGNVPGGTISGEVPRNLNLSEVLKVLALSGVQCEIEGRKLTVFD